MNIKEIATIILKMLEESMSPEEADGAQEAEEKAVDAPEHDERLSLAWNIVTPVWDDSGEAEAYFKLTKRALSLNVSLECWYDSEAKRKVAWITVPTGTLLGQRFCSYLSSGERGAYFTQKDQLRVRVEGRYVTGQINYNMARINQLLNIIFMDALIIEAGLFFEKTLDFLADMASTDKESSGVTSEDDVAPETEQMEANTDNSDIINEGMPEWADFASMEETDDKAEKIEEPEAVVKAVNMDSLPRGWAEDFPEVKALLYLKMRAWELGGTLRETYAPNDTSDYWMVLTAPCETPVFNAMIAYPTFLADSSDVLISRRSNEKMASWELPLTNRESFAVLRSLFSLAEELSSNTAEECCDLVRTRKDVHSRALKCQHFVELLRPVFTYGHTYDLAIENGTVKISHAVIGNLEMKGDTIKMILGYLVESVEDMNIDVMLKLLEPFWMYYGCSVYAADGDKVVVSMVHERYEIVGNQAAGVLEQILGLIGE